jgi:hypothetical protein
MKNRGRFFVVATLAAAWAGIAHGGAFNACTVTYDYDGAILINGERFFPVGTYFVPPGWPEGSNPSIEDAYGAYAANGGNILIGPRFYNITWPTYADHALPSDLYYAKTECVNHLNAANQYGVKLIPCPHIYWWWDAETPGGPGPHPIAGEIVGNGWPIEQSTQLERFSGLEPDGGIKGWVEAGASAAFMGWNHWNEPTHVFWYHRYGYENPPKGPGREEPTAANMQQEYEWLRALEDNPTVNAKHPTLFYDPIIVRYRDLWPYYFEAADIVGYNTIPVPEPYICYFRDKGENPPSWLSGGWLPNYHCAVGGDVGDVLFEVVDANKSVFCVVQNHYLRCDPWLGMGAEPTEGQYRFMTYDGIIHRANGILYGGQTFATFREQIWKIYHGYWDPCKPTFNEIGQGGVMHEVLKGEYDNLLVEVITKQQGFEVERSAFIGGELAPKNHFLSANILMEGCVKKYAGYSYLIVACRVGIDQFNPTTPPPYAVTFRPYFSSKTTWSGTVEVIGEEGPGGGQVRTIDIVNGTFTDDFDPEEVHIYKFQRPSPYVPD